MFLYPTAFRGRFHFVFLREDPYDAGHGRVCQHSGSGSVRHLLAIQGNRRAEATHRSSFLSESFRHRGSRIYNRPFGRIHKRWANKDILNIDIKIYDLLFTKSKAGLRSGHSSNRYSKKWYRTAQRTNFEAALDIIKISVVQNAIFSSKPIGEQYINIRNHSEQIHSIHMFV